MNATSELQTSSRQPRPRRHATEVALPDGRIEITSGRSRRRVIIEQGSSDSPQGRLVRVVGLPFDMNIVLKTQYAGRWDPVTRSWTLPASKGIALRAYLHDHF